MNNFPVFWKKPGQKLVAIRPLFLRFLEPPPFLTTYSYVE